MKKFRRLDVTLLARTALRKSVFDSYRFDFFQLPQALTPAQFIYFENCRRARRDRPGAEGQLL